MATSFETQYTDVSGPAELRLSDYLVTLVDHWRMIAAVTLLALALGTVYALLQKPVYRADAMIQVEESKGGNAANANQGSSLQTLSSIFDPNSSTAAEIELIRSRLVVEEAVRKLHLDIAARPRYFPVIGAWLAAYNSGLAPPTELLGLSQYAWGAEAITISLLDTPQKYYGKVFKLIADSAHTYTLRDPEGNTVLQGRVGEEAEGTTALGPVRIRVDALVGRSGSQFELVRASTIGTVERIQRALAVAESALQSGIIRASLEGPDPKLTADIVNTVARQFVQQDIGRRSAEAEHTLAFLDQQLPALRKELDLAEERYNSFRNRQGTVNLGEESRLLLQQIVENKTSLARLQTRLAEIRTHYTDANPAVVALMAQIETLSAQQSTLRRSVSVLPDTEQTALRLERDVRVDTELYTNLLNNAQQLRIVKAGQVGNVRVVDFAEPADDPIRPQRAMLVLISGGIGLVLGAMLAFLRKALYGGVEHPEEIERMLGVPVCAVVPRSQTQLRLQRELRASGSSGLGVLAARAPDDIAVEGVRALRTTLQYALHTARNNVVMLTGSRQDAGKSFLSVNLAALVASGRKRVLLIDGDMRRGEVHVHFGLSQVPGLSDALMGTDIDSVVIREVLPGLDVLTRGSLPPDPAELLMSDRFHAMLDLFKQRYDMVIIDTPPVLAVTDATLLGRHAGTTLLVVRHGRHSAAEVTETARRLTNGGVTLHGVLLTDVPRPPLLLRTGYTEYYGYEGRVK
ncbi:polysaccharide biosynthesis tyrosine autokinase [Cupriavidus basilensis]|uniref:polysaccharide biosynthesis tyrosine autokinase n=1 Tax=Cupriavidus basilensis TaxID=68895 RepID=UPI00157A800E|nr:polysaccharide biosynthesis tyrosine autokinase [Cupriavidus basilensis]NUA27585.1 polysaccharide biosynthesis tyrosine autokinase [Cupriavidus basilensis]